MNVSHTSPPSTVTFHRPPKYAWMTRKVSSLQPLSHACNGDCPRTVRQVYRCRLMDGQVSLPVVTQSQGRGRTALRPPPRSLAFVADDAALASGFTRLSRYVPPSRIVATCSSSDRACSLATRRVTDCPTVPSRPRNSVGENMPPTLSLLESSPSGVTDNSSSRTECGGEASADCSSKTRHVEPRETAWCVANTRSRNSRNGFPSRRISRDPRAPLLPSHGHPFRSRNARTSSGLRSTAMLAWTPGIISLSS